MFASLPPGAVSIYSARRAGANLHVLSACAIFADAGTLGARAAVRLKWPTVQDHTRWLGTDPCSSVSPSAGANPRGPTLPVAPGPDITLARYHMLSISGRGRRVFRSIVLNLCAICSDTVDSDISAPRAVGALATK